MMSASPNLGGLRKEAMRRLERSYKKLAKAEERASRCEARQAELMSQDSPPLHELEALPNCAALRHAVDEQLSLSTRLQELSDGLQGVSSPADSKFDELVALAATLEVGDSPPPRPQPVRKKKKGPRPSKAPRLPYRVYSSLDGAEIRVGRTAADNDLLSCEPAHRDPDDWWMHASGCPGSHVTIRSDSLKDSAQLPKEVELDAAVLAAKYSKAQQSGMIPVNLCRARQVSKPHGAKPGLVRLTGNVRTVLVDWRQDRHRLERLEMQYASSSAVPS
ncbi:MAG: hypothetical protein SGPRY_001798 [Prymnesium sp.]